MSVGKTFTSVIKFRVSFYSWKNQIIRGIIKITLVLFQLVKDYSDMLVLIDMTLFSS